MAYVSGLFAFTGPAYFTSEIGAALLGLGVAFAALFRRVQPMVSGDVPPYQKSLKAAHVPVILHMVLVLVIGLYMPAFLNDWFHTAVELLK